MCSNWLKYIFSVCLMIIYINRGLFVAMPSTETCCAIPSASEEINSLLELIISWAGIHNDIDEDGDSPESHDAAKTIQPLIDQTVTSACLACTFASKDNTFYLRNDSLPLLYIYGTIDHPPEIAQ